jgi:hypothetical protein
MLTQLLEEFAGELEAVAVPANSEEAGELMNMILQGAWNETNDPKFLERAHAQLELTQSDLVVKRREVEAVWREVEAVWREVEAVWREVEAGQRQVKAEKESLEARQRIVEEAQREVEAIQRRLEEEQGKVEEAQRKVEEAQRKVEALQRKLEAGQRQVKAEKESLEARQREVEEAQRRLEEEQRRLEAGQRQVKAEKESLEARQRQFEEEERFLKEPKLRIVLTYISIWKSKFGNTVPNLAGIADYSLLIRGLIASDILRAEDLGNPLVIIMKELSRAEEYKLDLSNSRIDREKLGLLLPLLSGTTIKVINFTGVEISDEFLAVLTEGLENTDVVEVEGIEPNPELSAVLAENATRVVSHSEYSSDFGGVEPPELQVIPADIAPNSPSAAAVAGNGEDMLDSATRPDSETAAMLAEQTRRTEELEAQMQVILKKLEESQKDPINERKSKEKQRAQKREEKIQQELDDLRAQLADTQDKVADLSRAREEELKNLRKDISGVVGRLLGENPKQDIVQLEAELQEKLQALENSLSSGIGANQRALDDLDKRTKKNEKSLEDINMSEAPQAWLDLQDRHLVKYAPNNNAKKYKEAFCKRLGHLFRGFENIDAGLLPQLSLPWDLEEATSAKDMHEGAVEAMAAGVNFVDAVCSQFPLIAAGSKALVAFCNHYRLKKEQVKSDIILSAIPTPEAMSEIARHLSIFLARHHAKHVFDNLLEETIYEGWRAKLINSNSRFLRFFKPIASIGRRIESKNVLAEELGQADANKAMSALLASPVVDKSHSVETIMLSGIGYDDGDKEKWRGVRHLDDDERTEHSHFVSELYKAIGKRADRAAGYFVSASMPTHFPTRVENSQVAASAAAALKQGPAPAAVQQRGGAQIGHP